MENAYIGIGSNLADPAAQVEAGLRALDALPQSHLLRRSPLYRSAPWGHAEQPDFINAVALIETGLAAAQLLHELHEVERRAGRDRATLRWGPRVLDLDILLYGVHRIDEPGLHVPHPHLHERAFVLVPLAQIAPRLNVPGRGPVSALLAGIDVDACRPIELASVSTP
jgi:2-amino-4-hydroxy-6-hydroxymethyldihydropteridine diphosphokinase